MRSSGPPCWLTPVDQKGTTADHETHPTPRWPEPFRRDQFDYLTDDELELLIESSSVLQFSPATNSTNGCLVASVGGLSSPADWVGELEYGTFHVSYRAS